MLTYTTSTEAFGDTYGVFGLLVGVAWIIFTAALDYIKLAAVNSVCGVLLKSLRYNKSGGGVNNFCGIYSCGRIFNLIIS